jgi:S-adenosylmethionine-dependent methyltransferase
LDGPVPDGSEESTFDEHRRAWQEYVATPWARIRYAVVAETLARHLAPLGGRLRVLDVGGGDGHDSLPLASAGHDVTILDPSESMLAAARASAEAAGSRVTTRPGSIEDLADADGDWDVVLCHYVLRYRLVDAGDVATLAAVLRPGGLLSIVDGNSPGTVLARAVRDGPAAATAALTATTVRTVTFDRDVRVVDASSVRADLQAAGCQILGEYGGRIVNDLILDEQAKDDPVFFEHLLHLELALCDREPFKRIGQFWQLVAARSAAR